MHLILDEFTVLKGELNEVKKRLMITENNYTELQNRFETVVNEHEKLRRKLHLKISDHDSAYSNRIENILQQTWKDQRDVLLNKKILLTGNRLKRQVSPTSKLVFFIKSKLEN